MESNSLPQLCNHLCPASVTQCDASDVRSSSVVISQCCILFHCVRVIWFVFILLLMDIWVFSSLELQPKMLTWSFWYVSLVSTVSPSVVITVSRMTGLYDRHVFRFGRYRHTVIQSRSTNLHSHWQHMKPPVGPQSHQRWYYLFHVSHLMNVQQYHIVFICVSLITNASQVLFHLSIGHYISYFVKCLFMTFAHFSIRLSISY